MNRHMTFPPLPFSKIPLMPRFVFVFLLLFLLQPARADFAVGCSAYEAGKYKTALNEFQEVAKTQLSAELAYNIGCTYSKLSDPGNASLWFLRATLLNPRHRESLQNLRYLKRREGLLGFDASPLETAAKQVKPSHWMTAGYVSIWVVGLTLAVLTLFKPRPLWPLILILCLGTTAGIAAGLGWFTRAREIPSTALGVVIEEGITANNAPAENADTVISLPPGSQIRPLEKRGDWTYLEVPNEQSTRGWVKTSSIEKLWPYPAHLVE